MYVRDERQSTHGRDHVREQEVGGTASRGIEAAQAEPDAEVAEGVDSRKGQRCDGDGGGSGMITAIAGVAEVTEDLVADGQGCSRSDQVLERPGGRPRLRAGCFETEDDPGEKSAYRPVLKHVPPPRKKWGISPDPFSSLMMEGHMLPDVSDGLNRQDQIAFKKSHV